MSKKNVDVRKKKKAAKKSAHQQKIKKGGSPKNIITRHAILVVDDEPSVLKALERTFKFTYRVFKATSGEEALKIFKENKNDISLVIADQRMPSMSGIVLLEKIRSIKPETIKIMLTAYTEISDIIDSINRCDLYHYITKPWEDVNIRLVVARAIESYERAMAIKEHSSELENLNIKLEEANKNLSIKVEQRTKALKRVNKELEKLAITDPLTGVSNRRYFVERLKKEFNRAKRYSHDLSLIMIDIDHFKKFNDVHGHLLGDSVLVELSSIFNSNVRTTDFVSRYGGEEFVLTLPETDKGGALEIAERIRKSVEKHNFPHSLKAKTGKITVSTGISSYPEDASTIRNLMEKADKAMYMAKNGGRNKIVLSR